jgi:hypothetical protein
VSHSGNQNLSGRVLELSAIKQEKLLKLLQQAVEMHHEGIKVSVTIQIYVTVMPDEDAA